jgi:hypothetical protein
VSRFDYARISSETEAPAVGDANAWRSRRFHGGVDPRARRRLGSVSNVKKAETKPQESAGTLP